MKGYLRLLGRSVLSSRTLSEASSSSLFRFSRLGRRSLHFLFYQSNSSRLVVERVTRTDNPSCFDVSANQWHEVPVPPRSCLPKTGSRVVRNGQTDRQVQGPTLRSVRCPAIAKKSEYRRFAIRGDDGKGALDDLSALYETLTRRFRHGNIAGDSGDSMDNERRAESSDTSASTTTASSPDGIRDAGVVQQNTNRHHFAYIPNLSSSTAAIRRSWPRRRLCRLRRERCAVCGLAKRLEEVWVPDDEYPIILKRQSEGMYLLQRVRDESHRFAITYHRQTRRKGALRSALDGIPGVGETYQKRLLSHFGSVRAMRDASVEELEAVKGIGHAKAEAIHTALHAE
mgnify:CR=1 FL=1